MSVPAPAHNPHRTLLADNCCEVRGITRRAFRLDDLDALLDIAHREGYAIGYRERDALVPQQLEAAHDAGWRAGMYDQLERLAPLSDRLDVLRELLDLLSDEVEVAMLAAAVVATVADDMRVGGPASNAFDPLEEREPPPPTSSTLAERTNRSARRGLLRTWLQPYLARVHDDGTVSP